MSTFVRLSLGLLGCLLPFAIPSTPTWQAGAGFACGVSLSVAIDLSSSAAGVRSIAAGKSRVRLFWLRCATVFAAWLVLGVLVAPLVGVFLVLQRPGQEVIAFMLGSMAGVSVVLWPQSSLK